MGGGEVPGVQSVRRGSAEAGAAASHLVLRRRAQAGSAETWLSLDQGYHPALSFQYRPAPPTVGANRRWPAAHYRWQSDQIDRNSMDHFEADRWLISCCGSFNLYLGSAAPVAGQAHQQGHRGSHPLRHHSPGCCVKPAQWTLGRNLDRCETGRTSRKQRRGQAWRALDRRMGTQAGCRRPHQWTSLPNESASSGSRDGRCL